MQRCVHTLDDAVFNEENNVQASYCGAALCLLCRRKKAIDERRNLKRLLDTAQSATPPPLLFFQTLTLQDARPAEVQARAGLLVRAFGKLRRKLPHHLGWARVIETKTSDFNADLENCHLHFVMLFPSGLAEDIDAVQWDELWHKCAGDLARDCDPNARIAENTESVVNYLTKSFWLDFVEDADIGIADPLRYVHRVQHGHSKFSYGGILNPPVFSKIDKLCGLDATFTDEDGVRRAVIPRSTIRAQRRQCNPPTFPDEIPIEGAIPRAVRPRRKRR